MPALPGKHFAMAIAGDLYAVFPGRFPENGSANTLMIIITGPGTYHQESMAFHPWVDTDDLYLPGEIVL